MCETALAASPATRSRGPDLDPAPAAAAVGSGAGVRSLPASAAQALAAVREGLAYLAAANASELTAAEQADCLRSLAAAESVHLAATARILRAFDSSDGFVSDGQATAKAWLRWQTRITRPAAGAATAWMRRLAAHPAVAAALAAGQLSPSYARQICEWTDELSEEHRADADQILTDAAVLGELADLAGLAEEIRARTARPDADDGDDDFANRRVFLTPHYLGNTRLDGELTPQAAAALQAVLDSLGKRAGPEDLRSRAERYHDALEEACRRLLAAKCLPDRAGQPVQIQLGMTLSQLLGQPDADPALAAWTSASDAPAPPGADCDASIVPIVTGTIDQEVLDQLAARLLQQLSDAGGHSGKATTALPRPAPLVWRGVPLGSSLSPRPSNSSPDRPGWPPGCARRVSLARPARLACRWTSEPPPRRFLRTFAEPSPAVINIARGRAATSRRKPATCTT